LHFVKKTYGHELGLSACFRQHRAKSHCRFLHGYPLSFTFTFAADG
jgi:6-pyruvoyltetrahydropterin/6-carboxytetrahydropterin synthase